LKSLIVFTSSLLILFFVTGCGTKGQSSPKKGSERPFKTQENKGPTANDPPIMLGPPKAVQSKKPAASYNALPNPIGQEVIPSHHGKKTKEISPPNKIVLPPN